MEKLNFDLASTSMIRDLQSFIDGNLSKLSCLQENLSDLRNRLLDIKDLIDNI